MYSKIISRKDIGCVQLIISFCEKSKPAWVVATKNSRAFFAFCTKQWLVELAILYEVEDAKHIILGIARVFSTLKINCLKSIEVLRIIMGS